MPRAAPASADTTGSTGPVGYSQPAATAPQSNTVTNTQTATATGGAGGTATGGNAGPAQSGGSHGGAASANGGSAESHNSLESKQSNSGRDSYSSSSGGNGDRYGFVSDGQDSFRCPESQTAGLGPRCGSHEALSVRQIGESGKAASRHLI